MRLIFTLILMLAVSCKSRDTNHITGYSEGDTAGALNSSTGVVVPAEYEPKQAVLLDGAYLLRRPWGIRWIKAIIKQGTFVWLANIMDSSILSPALGDAELSFVRILKVKTSSQWIRDYGPIMGKLNKRLVVLDQNYFSERFDHWIAGGAIPKVLSDRQADEEFPKNFANQLSYQRISLPIYSEGGNLLPVDLPSDGGSLQKLIVMSDKVVHVNSSKNVVNQRDSLDRKQIVRYYRNATGREPWIVPAIPWEGENTKHVDMWLAPLAPGKVMIAELQDEGIFAMLNFARAFGRSESSIDTLEKEYRGIQNYLNARAIEFMNRGFTVERSPLLVIGFGSLATYTNSLIANGTAYLPDYSRLLTHQGSGENKNKDTGSFSGGARRLETAPDPAMDESLNDMARLNERYAKHAKEIFKDYHYYTVAIDAAEAINDGGAIHCLSQTVPE